MGDRLLILLARIRLGMETRADADTLGEIVNDYEWRIAVPAYAGDAAKKLAEYERREQ